MQIYCFRVNTILLVAHRFFAFVSFLQLTSIYWATKSVQIIHQSRNTHNWIILFAPQWRWKKNSDKCCLTPKGVIFLFEITFFLCGINCHCSIVMSKFVPITLMLKVLTICSFIARLNRAVTVAMTTAPPRWWSATCSGVTSHAMLTFLLEWALWQVQCFVY